VSVFCHGCRLSFAAKRLRRVRMGCGYSFDGARDGARDGACLVGQATWRNVDHHSARGDEPQSGVWGRVLGPAVRQFQWPFALPFRGGEVE
jgi:hypothetical protein